MLDELEEKREEEKQEEGGRQGERNKTLNEEGEGDLTTPPWTGSMTRDQLKVILKG